MVHYSATSAVGKVSLLHGSYGRPDTKPNVYSCTVPKTLDIGMVHFKLPENQTVYVLSHILQDASVTCHTNSLYHITVIHQ